MPAYTNKGGTHKFCGECGVCKIVKNQYFIDWIFLSLDTNLVANVLNGMNVNDQLNSIYLNNLKSTNLVKLSSI